MMDRNGGIHGIFQNTEYTKTKKSKNILYLMDVTKTGNGERGAGNGERKSENE